MSLTTHNPGLSQTRPCHMLMDCCAVYEIKWKTIKYHTVETFLIPNRKSHRKRQRATHDIQIHEYSLSWVGTGTSIKRGGVKASFTSLNPLLIKLKKTFLM